MRAARAFGAVAAVAALTTLVPSGLAAQATAQMAQSRSTGSRSGGCQLGRGFECSYEAKTRRAEDGAESIALEVVVVWRLPENEGRPSARMADSAVLRAYRAFAQAVEDQGRSFGGGVVGSYWTAVVRPGMRRMWDWEPGKPFPPDSLWVADSAFEVPSTDSMLVILVDGAYTPDGPAPRIHRVVRRPSEWRETGAKQWTNGDTTFMVRPRRARSRDREDLLAIPEVRAFVERPRSP